MFDLTALAAAGPQVIDIFTGFYLYFRIIVCWMPHFSSIIRWSCINSAFFTNRNRKMWPD